MADIDFNTLASKIDEIKRLLVSEKKIYNNLQEIITEFNSLRTSIEFISKSNQNSLLNEIKEKILLIKNNNSQLILNNEKLINKPIGLLEIIYNALKEGKDLSNDLENINNAIVQIKNFDNNKISALNNKNISLIDELINLEENPQNNNDTELLNKIDIISKKLNELNKLIYENETNSTDIHNTLEDNNDNSSFDEEVQLNNEINLELSGGDEKDEAEENESISEPDNDFESDEEISTKEKPLNINIEYAKNEDEDLDEE